MNKKSQIWVSAALYFGLGIIVLSIILAAGMPVINKLKDKNTVIQTKDVMYKLDNNIRDVIRSGPGEQRAVNIEIKKGEFRINADNEKESVNWSMETKVMLSEPGVPIQEGYLTVLTEESAVVDEYVVKLSLSYYGIADLDYINPTGVIAGSHRLIIKNKGTVGEYPDKKILVEIKEVI